MSFISQIAALQDPKENRFYSMSRLLLALHTTFATCPSLSARKYSPKHFHTWTAPECQGC
jgi:hypothetical protein